MYKTSVQVSTAPCEWCGRVGGFHEQQCCAPVPLPPAPHPSDEIMHQVRMRTADPALHRIIEREERYHRMIDNARSSLLDLTEAFRIAVEVHGAQRDKAGEPYMGHICRVMSAMDTDEERAVAILHDALEDDRRVGGLELDLRRLFPGEIVDAVLALTRRRITTQTLADLTQPNVRAQVPAHEPYLDYIRRLSTNPLAVKVKLADLADNMDLARLAKLSEAEHLRLLEKYGRARKYLVTTLRPNAAPVASAPHR